MFGKKNETEADFRLYTFHDSKTGSYSDPVFALNNHDITRQVLNSMKADFLNKEKSLDLKSKYYVNAEDYSIFEIGSFYRKTGTVAPQNLTHVANLIDLRSLVESQSGH